MRTFFHFYMISIISFFVFLRVWKKRSAHCEWIACVHSTIHTIHTVRGRWPHLLYSVKLTAGCSDKTSSTFPACIPFKNSNSRHLFSEPIHHSRNIQLHTSSVMKISITHMKLVCNFYVSSIEEVTTKTDSVEWLREKHQHIGTLSSRCRRMSAAAVAAAGWRNLFWATFAAPYTQPC